MTIYHQNMRNLDIDQLRSFLTVADFRSFTAAGGCLGATQSAISLRIAKLEAQLGKRLLARTPRSVVLTPDGDRFLPLARRIVETHDAAVAEMDGAGTRPEILRLAISDHATAGRLPAALQRLRAALPRHVADVTVGTSAEMQAIYDAGSADAAIIRQDADRRDGEPLYEDPLVWIAGESMPSGGNVPLDLVTLRGPCGVKAAMTRALDEAGLSWRIAFQGGSVSALEAAVEAGLGVTAVGLARVPSRCAVVTGSLPGLPAGRVVLHTRLRAPLRQLLGTAFRPAGIPPSRNARLHHRSGAAGPLQDPSGIPISASEG